MLKKLKIFKILVWISLVIHVLSLLFLLISFITLLAKSGFLLSAVFLSLFITFLIIGLFPSFAARNSALHFHEFLPENTPAHAEALKINKNAGMFIFLIVGFVVGIFLLKSPLKIETEIAKNPIYSEIR